MVTMKYDIYNEEKIRQAYLHSVLTEPKGESDIPTRTCCLSFGMD